MIIQDPKFEIGETIRLIGTFNHVGTVISSHYNVTRLMYFWTYKVALARSAGGTGEWIETDCEKIE